MLANGFILRSLHMFVLGSKIYVLKTLFSLYWRMTILKNSKTWNSTFQTHWIKDIEVAKQTLNCVLLHSVETSTNKLYFNVRIWTMYAYMWWHNSFQKYRTYQFNLIHSWNINIINNQWYKQFHYHHDYRITKSWVTLSYVNW